jgi:hypothetical protein
VQPIVLLVQNLVQKWLEFLSHKRAYIISTPGGKIASNQIIRHVPIKLGSNTIKTDLILLALEGMDNNLGMNWMALHGLY